MMNLNAKLLKILTVYDKNSSNHTLISQTQSSEQTYTSNMFRVEEMWQKDWPGLYGKLALKCR